MNPHVYFANAGVGPAFFLLHASAVFCSFSFLYSSLMVMQSFLNKTRPDLLFAANGSMLIKVNLFFAKTGDFL